jgi:heparan-alpha-glucosaminide N-acetyltransferase
MKKYEAIKSFEDNDEDLEMGNDQISDSTTKLNNKKINNEECSSMISSSMKQQQPQQSSQRLLSLDVFRGLTVALMILVDDAGGLIPALNHSPWNGLTIADFVMPFFLFIVGVALAFTYKKPSCKVDATRKAILRALKLLALGIFLQGGYVHRVNDLSFGVDLKQIRWMGILQRIAVAYLITALCEIWLKREDIVNSGSTLLRKYRYQWALALFLSVIYLCLLYGMYVPDWEYEVPTEPSSEPMIFSVSVNVFYFFLTCFYLFLFIYRLKKLIYVHLFEYVLG